MEYIKKYGIKTPIRKREEEVSPFLCDWNRNKKRLWREYCPPFCFVLQPFFFFVSQKRTQANKTKLV